MTVFGVHAGLQHTTAGEMRGLWRRIEALGFGWISVWDHFYAATMKPDDAACLESVAMHAALAVEPCYRCWIGVPGSAAALERSVSLSTVRAHLHLLSRLSFALRQPAFARAVGAPPPPRVTAGRRQAARQQATRQQEHEATASSQLRRKKSS